MKASRLILILFLFFSASSLFSAEKITFKGRDNKVLKGLWTPPKTGKKVFICLHGLLATKAEWEPFREAMTKQGWGVLAYDARGHGESSKGHDDKGVATDVYRFGPPRRGSDWEKMIDDVGGAVQFIRSQVEGQPDIWLAGASLGANVALNYASLSRAISGVLLLSPGLDYQGIRTDSALGRLSGSVNVLAIAHPKDGYAFQSSKSLKEYDPKIELWTDVPEGHGVQMFDEKLLDRILKWLP